MNPPLDRELVLTMIPLMRMAMAGDHFTTCAGIAGLHDGMQHRSPLGYSEIATITSPHVYAGALAFGLFLRFAFPSRFHG